MPQLLGDIVVLDLSRYFAGPYCTAILADVGAKVIRIEPPDGGDDRTTGPWAPTGENYAFYMMGRNKRGITLDIEHPRGKELLFDLVRKADVIVENFSPPAKEKLGLAYPSLKHIKSDIIMASISAFGDDGPYRDRTGFDLVGQAESGIMSFTGFPENPPTRAQLPWLDYVTGLHAALGIILAIMQRQLTGEGQFIETALLDSAVSLVGMGGPPAQYQVAGELRPRLGNSSYYSFADAFDAKDGLVFLMAPTDSLWRRLSRLIGHPELAADPRFKDCELRYLNFQEARPLVAEWVRGHTVEEVIEEATKARVPNARVNGIPEMLADPHVAARKLLPMLNVPGIGDMVHPRLALRMSGIATDVRHIAPGLGEHNEEIYGGLLGLSIQELASLRQQGIV